MTQREKLDKILNGLMSRLPKRYETGTDNKILTFKFLCSILFKDENMEPWEVANLKDILIRDGYVEMIDVEGTSIPSITHTGKKFILDGGYKKEQERKIKQDELVKTSIESNKISIWALAVSIASFLVAFAALIIGLLK
jgi:hypothetical protein